MDSCELSTHILRGCFTGTGAILWLPQCQWSNRKVKGILPKGPYLPCVSMAGRVLLAGYHRSMGEIFLYQHHTKHNKMQTICINFDTNPRHNFTASSFTKLRACLMMKDRVYVMTLYLYISLSRWIHEMEGVKLKIVQASDSNYMQTMERAIRVGDPVLLQVGVSWCGLDLALLKLRP